MSLRWPFYLCLAFCFSGAACSHLKSHEQVASESLISGATQGGSDLDTPAQPKAPSPEDFNYKKALELFRTHQHNEALPFFEAFKNSSKQSGNVEKQALGALYITEIFLRQGEYQKAIREVEPFELTQLSMPLAAKLAFRKALAHQKLGHFSKAFITYTLFPNNYLQAIEIITQLSESDIMALLEVPMPPYIESHLQRQWGVLLLDRGELEEGASHLEMARRLSEDGDFKDEVSEIIDKIRNRYKAKWKHIGLVIPLDGRYAAIAENIIRGFTMGLGPDHPFVLRVINSNRESFLYEKELKTYIENEHPIAIVGAPLNATSEAVAKVIDLYGTPFISLSGANLLKSPYVFQNALTMEVQMRALLDHLLSQFPESQFGILYPNEKFGVRASNVFWDQLLLQSKTLTAAQSYQSKQKNFLKELRKLVGTYYLKDREEEYRKNMALWLEQSPSSRSKIPVLLEPKTDFQFLFLPDGISTLVQVAPSLSYVDIEGVSLIGTSIWNSKSLVRQGGRYVEGVIFPAPYFEKEFLESSFYKNYETLYALKPGIMSTESYDTGLFFRHLVKGKGHKSRNKFIEGLRGLKNFDTSLGLISVTEDQIFKRVVKILTVSQGEVVLHKELDKK